VRIAFSDFVPLSSVVNSDSLDAAQRKRSTKYQLSLWRQLILVGIPLATTCVWAAVWAGDLLAATRGEERVVDVLLSAGMVVVWVSEWTIDLENLHNAGRLGQTGPRTSPHS
jgi:hypothetical protein